MKFGICNLSVIPVRAQPLDKSEMVTQLLFGERYEILDEKEKWSLIKPAFDSYECWIDKKQVFEISQEPFNKLDKDSGNTLTGDLFGVITNVSKNQILPVLPGSTLPHYNSGKCILGEDEWQYQGNVVQPVNNATKEQLTNHANIYINAPYLWGGRTPFGVDCSGFVQMVFKLSGINLPRDSSQQAEVGETVNAIEEADVGDLAFFDNEGGDIVHVGMIINDNRIIHASGKVRIDKIDEQGIYNEETAAHTHHLKVIKRVC